MSLFLSGKVRKLQHPPPPLFVPVKAAVTPPAGHNRAPLERTVKAKVIDGPPTAMPVNPFSKAAKGTGRAAYNTRRGSIPVSTVLRKSVRELEMTQEPPKRDFKG